MRTFLKEANNRLVCIRLHTTFIRKSCRPLEHYSPNYDFIALCIFIVLSKYTTDNSIENSIIISSILTAYFSPTKKI